MIDGFLASILLFSHFFKKICLFSPRMKKDILEMRLTGCLFFAIIGWGHKKMKLFCSQYARPSQHCFFEKMCICSQIVIKQCFGFFRIPAGEKTGGNISGGFL